MSCNWPLVSLADVTSKIGDGLHGTPKYDDNGEYFFINGNNLSNGSIIINESTKRASEEEYLKHKKDLNDRTILVSINGTLGNIGTYQGEKVFLGKSACYLNILPEVDKDFIRYVLTGHDFQNYIHNLATGSTIKNAGLKLMREYEFKLPDHKTQKSISTVLNSVDLKINTNRNINQTLEEMTQAIFKSWFIDFDPVKVKMRSEQPVGMDEATATLFPDKLVESELGLIPEGWKVKKLEDILELAYGKALKKTDRKDGDVPVYGSGGLTGYHDISIVDGPGIIVGRKGTVGSVNWEPNSFYPIDTVFYVKNKSGYSLNYCYLVLQNLGLHNMNTDAAVPGLNRNNVYRLDISIPSDEILKTFEQVITSLQSKIDANNSQNIQLGLLRDTLLPKLLSGEVELESLEVKGE